MYEINKISIDKIKERNFENDDYIISYKLNNDLDPDFYLLCPLNLHIIVYCIGEKIFFLKKVKLRLNYLEKINLLNLIKNN